MQDGEKVRQATVIFLLALILSNAFVAASITVSTKNTNMIQRASVEAIQTESDPQVKPAPRLEPKSAPSKSATQVVIEKKEEAKQAPSNTSENADISDEDLELLARIVSAEARDEPYEGQVAVAAVVLNRVNNGFGKTIRDVIYAKGQFQPVRNGSIKKKPAKSAYQAAKDAVNGDDPSKGALYFADMKIAKHHPNPKAKKTVKIGTHTFFK